MKKEKKEQIVREFVEIFSESGVYLMDFKGLNVAEITELRSQLSKANVSMRVVKNTLAKRALEKAGIKISDVKAIKTHQPFAINDIYMATKMGIDVNWMNNYGNSMIYGHPQGPTAGRIIIELLEETVMLGGGYCLWAGCAAGDTGAALVFKIS